jgi:hypothetical protein
MHTTHPLISNPVILKYMSVVFQASRLTEVDDLTSWVQQNADILDSGNEVAIAGFMSGDLQIDEAFALLDTSKALVAKTLIHQKDAKRCGKDPKSPVISFPTPDIVAAYLNSRKEDTAIVSFHVIGNQVVILVARNRRRPDLHGMLPGYGNVMYSYKMALGLNYDLIESLEEYKRSLAKQKYDFQLVRQVFDFLGISLFSMLWSPMPPEEIIFIPHKLFNLLPFHAFSVDGGNERIFLHDFVKNISYASCIQELVFAGTNQDRPLIVSRPQLLFVRDDSASLPSLQLEKKYLDLIQAQVKPGDMEFSIVTKAEDLPNDFQNYSWVNWSSHARSNSSRWGDCNLSLGAHKIDALKIINDWELDSRPIVMLAACESAVDTSGGYLIDEYCGLDLAFRIAGARAVVASLWRAEDLSAAYASSLIFGWWLTGKLGPGTTLTTIQHYFRTRRWKDFLIRDNQMRELPSTSWLK